MQSEKGKIWMILRSRKVFSHVLTPREDGVKPFLWGAEDSVHPCSVTLSDAAVTISHKTIMLE